MGEMFRTGIHKVPKFWDARKLCCNLPKILTKMPKLRVFYQNDANGIANSEGSDQTAPLINSVKFYHSKESHDLKWWNLKKKTKTQNPYDWDKIFL